jgi:hypothetical protein
MGMIEDVFKALDRIPIWKRLQLVPDEVNDLKKRVVELEEKLGGKWPADVCKYCGERSARLSEAGRSATIEGIKLERWTCSACGKTEPRHVRVP